MYHCTLFSYTKVTREHFLLNSGVHPRWALFLMEKGKFRCHMNNQQELVCERDCIVFPPKLRFEREILLPATFHYFQFHAQFPDYYFPYGKLSFCDTVRIEQIKNLLNQLPPAELPSFTALKQHLLNDILLQCFIHAEAIPVSKTMPDIDNDTQYLLEYFNEHFSKKISIQNLSKQLGLTHAGLITKFKRNTGVAPVVYLTRIRTEHAKKLLLNTTLPLSQIAAMCGYENAYYFSNAFKKSVGYSPSRYRQEMQI